MPVRKSDQPSEVDGGPVTLKSSLWELLQEGAARSPDGPAAVVMHQPADHLIKLVGPDHKLKGDHLEWSYSELVRASTLLARAFNTIGVKRRSKLVVFLENAVEYVLLFWTAAKLDLVFCPLDPAILEADRADELRYLLDVLKPSMIAVDDATEAMHFEKLGYAASEGAPLKLLCDSSNQQPPQGWSWLTHIAEAASEDMLSPQITNDSDPERPALLVFTSGTTTGRPKGCMQSVANLASSSAYYSGMGRKSPSSRSIVNAVGFRTQFVNLALSTWRGGGATIFPSARFDPTKTLDAIEHQGCTAMGCTPTQLWQMIQDPTIRNRKTDSLETFFLRGDVISKDMVKVAKEHFKADFVASSYGITESMGSIGWPRDFDDANIPADEEIVAVGTALPGSKLRICDEKRNVLPRGQTGSLHFGGTSVIKRYLGGEREDCFYADDKGNWWSSGDRALMDADGIVYVLGRFRDLIKRGETLISPAVLESFLNHHANLDSQIIGIPHPTFGQEPFLVIRNFESPYNSPVRIMKLLEDHFGPEYVLGGVLSLGQIDLDDWPYNATGKVFKARLREATRGYMQKSPDPFDSKTRWGYFPEMS